MQPKSDSLPEREVRSSHAHGPWWQQRRWLLIAALAGALALILGAEHRAHLLPALPYLFLLACPLMHLFMHRGHGHGGHSRKGGSADE